MSLIRSAQRTTLVVRMVLVVVFALFSSAGLSAPVFDHSYAEWNALLSRHVHWTRDGAASEVNYDGFVRDRDVLKHALQEFSGVSRSDFEAWSKPQRRAFLINAYNAFTIDLVLTKYPDLDSIKNLGTVWTSPWRRGFFDLFGETTSLDDIEQRFLRGAPDFDDPRIHFALNCASIGCPALRPEAYVADQLGSQLDDQARRFLADSSRNRLDSTTGTLHLSKIFQWYAPDFGKGFLNAWSVQQFLARYGDALHASATDVDKLRRNEFTVTYGEYNWALNSAR
ncbi:MAG: DUF547 domain-containing protein [Xanthomonadaceae bacterium]|nr:DUF547 domain-containing protein [Xanthomonadaceae bacterium]